MSKPIKNNSKLLYLQARQLFEQARLKFEDGTIKTEAKLIAAVFQSFQEFFTSMGKPNMVPRFAPEQGPPWSDDYNRMMNEIKLDLELLFQEVDILGRSLYTDFNHHMIQQEMVSKQFDVVLDQMKDLESYAGINGAGVQLGRDDFLSKDRIDYARISGTPLEIVDGAATLPQVSRRNVAPQAKTTIITGNRKGNSFILGTESNGLPGNNTEIHSVTDDVLTNRSYIPTFLGEENNHGDYGAILDGSPNTWFEYEKVNVREHDKVRVAKNLGWDYQVHNNQTISWAEDPEDGILKLHMQIVLDNEEVINQINCHLYTPPNYGAKTAVVKNILVSDGKEAPRSVMPKDRKAEQYHFHFPPIKAKVISIQFEQSQKYITDIGHIFYEKKMQVEDNSEYAMDMATKKYKYAPRVEGPLMSLEDLGIKVKVSENNVEANYPWTQSSGDDARSIGQTINRLIKGVDSETVDMGVEKFEGFRWCIGIRDIEIFSCEYADEGELVTHPFFFDQPLDKISLNVNENIPPVFSATDALKYDWLKYFVSIDDGATWHPITPMAHDVFLDDQPPKIYTVRMVESDEQQLDNKKAYIESAYPVYSLRMKIIAKRPNDYTLEGFTLKDQAKDTSSFIQNSPIVNGYLFQVETVQEEFNSEESEELLGNVSVDGISDKPKTGSEPTPEENIDIWRGMPPGTGGRDPWGDSDSDGAPNWDDPKHPDYVPPHTRTPNWEPPNRPKGNTYPSGGRKPPIGGPYDDDNGDGTPNHLDPEWKPPLTVTISNKKSEWCEDKELVVKGVVYSANELKKVELLVNGVTKQIKSLTGNLYNFEFAINHEELNPSSLTIVVKAFDSRGSSLDMDVLNVIDCTSLPPEDRPSERSAEQINVVIDKKVPKLCECDTLLFYGSAQGPKPIQTMVFRINGIAVDPNNLGTPPENDPCGGSSPSFQMKEQEFTMMNVSNEKTFRVEIPYWKLKQLGVKVNTTMKVEVFAYDSTNAEASDSFLTAVENCHQPPLDEQGNARVRECYELESVEVHYYDHMTKKIEIKTIPANALPYSSIHNGAGSSVTVGWKSAQKAPVIMQTAGYDDSGVTFQIHAVGLHYLNEYDQSKTKWTTTVGERTDTIKNPDKMVGDPDRLSEWTIDMENGDYSTAPSLGKINDYATFMMDNDWLTKSCAVKASDFLVVENRQPEEPAAKECQIVSDCNKMTHIVFQVFDEAAKQLKIYKVDVSESGKDTYQLTTKNGVVTLTAGWVDYFKGPAIQLKTATGTDNILITALGVVYRNKCGDSQTAWSTQLRYKTNGVKYPEFVIGGKKELSSIGWIQEGIVDYTQATYIGKQGDIVAFRVDEEFTNEMCQPEKSIDSSVGVDKNNPPDIPEIEFTNAVTEVCYEDDQVAIMNAVVTDNTGLKDVTYGMSVNGVYIQGPYTDQVNGLQRNLNFQISAMQLEIGDTVRLHITAVNTFNVSGSKTLDIVVASCDIEPPVISLTTILPQTSGKYCYRDVSSGNAPIHIKVTDDRWLVSWSGTATNWSDSRRYDAEGESRVTDTGVIATQVPIIMPAQATDSYGRTYLPDSTHTVTVTAADKSGKTASKTLTMVMTDCEYDPTPPPPPPAPAPPQPAAGTEKRPGEQATGSGAGSYFYILGSQPGIATVDYDFYGAADKMDVYYKNVLLHSTGLTTNQGSFTFQYTPDPDENRIIVVMNDGRSGSGWNFTVRFPT